jgi:hypothetical protein
MKVTTLACDFCTAVVPAVTSRRLVGGKPRPGDPQVDLCQRHLSELLAAFQPKPATGARGRPRRVPLATKLARVDTKRAGDRARHKRENERVHIHKPAKRAMRVGPPITKTGRFGNGHAPWLERMTLLSSLLPAVGYMPTLELERQAKASAKWKQLQMSDANYGLTLKKLKEQGMVAQKGNRRFSSYARADGSGNGAA